MVKKLVNGSLCDPYNPGWYIHRKLERAQQQIAKQLRNHFYRLFSIPLLLLFFYLCFASNMALVTSISAARQRGEHNTSVSVW